MPQIAAEKRAYHAAYMRHWRTTKQGREYFREYFRRFRSEGRELLRTRHRKAHAIHLLGGKCYDCKRDLMKHPEQADFDHVKGNKINNLARLWRGSRRKFSEELAKCELVCANCHRTRTQIRVTGLWKVKDFLNSELLVKNWRTK